MSTNTLATPPVTSGFLDDQVQKLLEFRRFDVFRFAGTQIYGTREVAPFFERVDVRVTPAEHFLVTVFRDELEVHAEGYVPDINALAQFLYENLYTA